MVARAKRVAELRAAWEDAEEAELLLPFQQQIASQERMIALQKRIIELQSEVAREERIVLMERLHDSAVQVSDLSTERVECLEREREAAQKQHARDLWLRGVL